MSESSASFWEGRYQDGDTPWDKGAAAPPLLEYLNHHQVQGRVCVPGCGSGHDVRALALHGAEVTGMDIAASALERARSFPLIRDEQYLELDFLNLAEVHENSFDYVFEHTCFCAIEPSLRAKHARSCARVLRNGGHLLAIFFMNPDSDEGPPYGVSESELEQLFLPHFEIIHRYIPQVAYPGREGREQLMLLKKNRNH